MDAPHTVKYRHVTWADVDASVARLGQRIRADGFKPDCVLSLLKGGMVPARLLSDFFGAIEVLPLLVRSYDGTRKTGEIHIGPFPYSVKNRSVLIADDIHDSGDTLMTVRRMILEQGARSVRTATLHYKGRALCPPDYSDVTVTPDEWVVFPWERYELKDVVGR